MPGFTYPPNFQKAHNNANTYTTALDELIILAYNTLK
jgi:hypothetical protein